MSENRTEIQPLTKKEFQTYLGRVIERTKARLDRFAEEFKENPADALGNAQNIFDTAAEYEMASRLHKQLDGNIKLEDISAGALRQLIIASRYPHRSTSAPSNMIEQSRLSALAEIVEYMRGCRV